MSEERDEVGESRDNRMALGRDATFMLGEINATVRTLPSRMDRFESQTSTAIADMRRDMQVTMGGFNSRIAALEQDRARHSGVTGTLLTVITIAAAAIGSVFSGLVTAFWKH
jgi:hypothetical protein